MQFLKKYRGQLLILFAYFILPTMLYGPVTFGSQTMIPADNLYQWYPWKAYAAEFGVTPPENSLLSDLVLQNYAWKQYINDTFSSGDIPLWNPHLFAGAPFLATGQNAAYYPFAFIFMVVPLTKAYGWYTLTQLWLGGLFTYILGRTLKQRRMSAFIAGIIFQGCGFMLVSAAVFPMMIGAAIWLPLLLACLEKIVDATTEPYGDGNTLPWATLCALALGMQILAGHIEITYYILLVMALFAAWRLGTRWIGNKWHLGPASRNTQSEKREAMWRFFRPFIWLIAAVGVGLMLGGIQFIPFYEVGITNFREGSSTLEEVRGWAFPTRRVLTFGLPNFYGNPSHHTYIDAFTGEHRPFSQNVHGQSNPHGPGTSNWGIKNYVEGGVYLGIISLILTVLGMYSAFRPQGRGQGRGVGRLRSVAGFFTILAGLSLSFIFGTPLYAILYYGLPGINQLHSPFRWVFPLSICVAVLAGYGMDYLQESREKRVESREGHPSNDSSLDSSEPKLVTRHSSLATLFASDPAVSHWIRPLVLWGPVEVVTGLAGLVFWGGSSLLIGLYASLWQYGAIEPIVEQTFLSLAQAPDAFANGREFYSYLFPQFRLLALILIMCGCCLRVSRCPIYWPKSLGGAPVYGALIALTLIVDLFVNGFGFNASVDPALLTFKPELIQWLAQQPDSHLWRVTTFDNKGTKPLNANTPWHFGLNDVRGYDSIIAKQYTEYMAAIEPQNELQFNRIQPLYNWESIQSPLVDLLGIKYIITEETLNLPKLNEVWAGEGLRVYENTAVMPRAYTLSLSSPALTIEGVQELEASDTWEQMRTTDPRQHPVIEYFEQSDLGTSYHSQSQFTFDQITQTAPRPATITVNKNREVWVDAAVDQPSWLILNDSYFPGWRAFVRPIGGDDDSEIEIPVARANMNFRAVELIEGEWSVRFQYSPYTFWLGGLTSVMGLVVVAFGGTVWLWRRFYRPDGELTNTRSIAKNSVAPMALNLFNRGIDFLFAAFYLRLLGPADAGAYTTAITIAGIFEILSNFGLNAYLIREVSPDKNKASSYLLNTTILRLGTGAMASIPIFLFLYGTDYRPDTITAVLYFMIGMILSGMASGLTGLFYAYEEAEIPATVTTVTTIMKVGFGVIVLLIGLGFVGLAAVSILVNLITLLILIFLVRRRYPLNGPWTIDFGLQRLMIRDSYPLMINHFLATVYWQVDVLILSQFNGEEVVGWYNTAYKYINAFNVIPSFFTFALFPVIARQVQSSLPDARRTFRMSAKLLTLVSLPLAAVVTLMAELMIQLLGGVEFIPFGYIALRTVIWSIPFGWLNSVTNYVLISLGQERVQTRAFVIGVGFNLVGNLLILPFIGTSGNAVIAAGATTIASEILLLCLFNYYLVQKMPSIEWGKLLWRPVVITAVMVAAMLALGQINLWLGLITGIIIYPAGLLLLRVFGVEEIKILQSILPAKIAGRLAQILRIPVDQ